MKKNNLRPDRVESEKLHVGIELELAVSCDNESGHDDDACEEAARENYSGESASSILRNNIGLTREEANQIESYFNLDSWIDDQMADYSCDDDECPYNHNDADSERDRIESELKELTGNQSFKVVSDGSIKTDSGEIDAEVCWNYYASKETVKDNEKILKYLNDNSMKFNASCGLHINLNNYLGIKAIEIPASEFGVLFDFVAPSRRKSNFCTKFGMSGTEKYSMIYNQGDRLEFRFFSPTLEADKLNHYVILANTIYNRLAGRNKKLPKNTAEYFINKMTKVNGLSIERAEKAVSFVNSILSASKYVVSAHAQNEDNSESEAA